MLKVLFVCSMAKMRSKTAAEEFKEYFDTLYAGTSVDATIKVGKDILDWADIIYCMEKCHRDRIRRKFSGYSKKIKVLDIEDIYEYDDPMLKMELHDKIWKNR